MECALENFIKSFSEVGITREMIDSELNRDRDIQDYHFSLASIDVNRETKLGLMLNLPNREPFVKNIEIFKNILSNDKVDVLYSEYFDIGRLFIGDCSKSAELNQKAFVNNSHRVTGLSSNYTSSDLRKIILGGDKAPLNRRDLEDSYARKFLGIENVESLKNSFRVSDSGFILESKSVVVIEFLKILRNALVKKYGLINMKTLDYAKGLFLYI